MVGGGHSTSPARRRGRRRPGDLAAATAVQSRGDANGGGSARGRRRAWPRRSRSSAVARLVPGLLGAAPPPRDWVDWSFNRLWCPSCGRLRQRRDAMWLASILGRRAVPAFYAVRAPTTP